MTNHHSHPKHSLLSRCILGLASVPVLLGAAALPAHAETPSPGLPSSPVQLTIPSPPSPEQVGLTLANAPALGGQAVDGAWQQNNHRVWMKAEAEKAAQRRQATQAADQKAMEEKARKTAAEKVAAEKRAQAAAEKKAAEKRAQAQREEAARNRWVAPITGESRIGAAWGATGSWSRYHTGQDFPAATGTPVFAVASGTVEEPTAGSWAGNHIILRLDNGDAVLYAHLSQVDATVGERVAPGQSIGLVGNTGRSFGSHLHFEWYPKGTTPGDVYTTKDPMALLHEHGVDPHA